MMEQDFNLDGLIWTLVGKFIKRNRIEKHLNSTTEDLFSEARLAAIIAITKYDSTKQTKLSTWIYDCVQNHLLDIADKECGRNEAAEFVELAPEEIEEIEDDSKRSENFEFIMSMKSILSAEEYALFMLHFVEDIPISVIVKNNVSSHKKARNLREAILGKYKTVCDYRVKARTQISLQREWSV